MMDADRLLSFDRYSLDLANERLLHDGDVVSLTPQAFAVLRCLVEDAGQLVRKDDLLRSVWRGTHVSDGVQRVIILEIRRALDDDSEQPRFIETVPRRGYRFIAPRTRTSRRPAAADENGTIVGRDGVIAALETRFARARAGERQLVFLSGEAGIGKTTVLDAFVARAAGEPDVMIARGACLEHYGVAEAYLPVLEAIGRLLREPGSDRPIRLPEKYAPTWVLQSPWLAPRDDRDALRRELVGVTKERMLREMSERETVADLPPGRAQRHAEEDRDQPAEEHAHRDANPGLEHLERRKHEGVAERQVLEPVLELGAVALRHDGEKGGEERDRGERAAQVEDDPVEDHAQRDVRRPDGDVHHLTGTPRAPRGGPATAARRMRPACRRRRRPGRLRPCPDTVDVVKPAM